MRRTVHILIGVASTAAVAACSLSGGARIGAPRVTATGAPGTHVPGTPGQASPLATVSTAPAASPPNGTAATGLVLGLDGKAAANVKITAYELITDGGASLVSNNGGSLISDNGSTALSVPPTGRRVLDQAPLHTTTDAEGHFTLALPAGVHANIEAAASQDVKAIQLDATGTAGLTLNLDYVGSIAGKVVPPKGSTATDLVGVDVFVPGTSYAAKTDGAGHYVMDGVPSGTFTLYAQHTGLGSATASGVKVAPKATTSAPDLLLSLALPTIVSIDPAIAAPGSQVTLKGQNFGATQGSPFTVTVAGLAVAQPTRVNDQTIQFKLPPTAQGGAVVVTVDGVPGPSATLGVASKLSIATAIHDLWVGAKLPLHVLLPGGDGKPLAAMPGWASDGPAVDVDASGTAVAKAAGSATISASLGSLTDHVTLTVHDAPFVATVAGSGRADTHDFADGVGTQARFNGPAGVAVGPDGTIYVADAGNNTIRRVTPDGVVTTLAGTPPAPGTATTGPAPGGLVDGKGPTAQFNDPQALALEPDGHLVVADTANNRIRDVAPDGTVSTVAGSGRTGDALNLGSQGGYQDGPANQAQFNAPAGVAVAADGSIYVADSGNDLIRRIATDGVVSTTAGKYNAGTAGFAGGYADGNGTAAQFWQPEGIAFGGDGTLYIVDQGNVRIRKMTQAGVVTTLSGAGPSMDGSTLDGPANVARFSHPFGIAVDTDGTLFVTDQMAARVRAVAPDGSVSTVAGPTGGGGIGPTAIDGLAGAARFGEVGGVAVGPGGHVYVADSGAHCLRVLVRKE